MGDKIVTIVTTIILLIIFMVLVAFISTDIQMDRSEKAVKALSEEIQYKGFITAEQYNATMLKIPLRSAKLNITHIKSDKFMHYLSGTLDMVFTHQILSKIASEEVYKDFVVGDQVQLDLVISESTFFDILIGMVTGNRRSGLKMIASESGVILNTKYN